MKTVLIVGYGSCKRKSIFEHIHLQKQELCIDKLVCLHEKTADWLENIIHDWILVPHFQQHPCACIPQIVTYCQTHSISKFDAILTFDEDCVEIANFLSLHFKTVASCRTNEILHQIKDKYLFRLKCQTRNSCCKFDDKMQLLQTPNIGYIPFFETVPNLIDSNLSTLPNCDNGFILKPRIGAGKMTVQKFATKEDLHSFLLLKQICWDNYMVEEFFEGNEVDLDCLVQNGVIQFIAISDNNPPLRDPFLQETGGNTPSLLPLSVQQQLKDMATELISWMEIENGCLHLEAKTNGRICMPIEINMRLGGAETFAMVYNCYHIDLIKYALEIALGQTISIPKTISQFSGPLLLSFNFHAMQSGWIQKLENGIQSSNKSRIKELVLFKKEGDVFQVPPMGFDSCYGWIVVSSNEPFLCTDVTKQQQILLETKSHLKQLCSQIRLDIL